MLISIRTAQGLTQLPVQAEDSPVCVFARLRELGVNVQDQVLECAGLHLHGRRSLAEHGVPDGATLTLVPQQQCEVRVKPLLKGEVFSLSVYPSTTIAGVKRKIQERLDMLPEDQALVLKGKKLEDGTMLCDIGPTVGVPLQLFLIPLPRPTQAQPQQQLLRPITVTVKLLTGTSFSVTVASSDTVAVLKSRIREQGYEPNRTHLIFKGVVIKDDTATMQTAGISDGYVVHLVVRSVPPCPGACGLQNLGNTCFFNSIVQALSNTVPLRQYVRSGQYRGEIQHTPLSTGGKLAGSFADLVRELWEASQTVVSPSGLLSVIRWKRPEFGDYRQHDAQELLTFLLDILHEDVNRAGYPRPMVDCPETRGKTDLQVASEAWQGSLRRNDSRILDIFQFQVRNVVSFPEVNDRSLTFEPMVYLSVPVPKTEEGADVVDLEQCLNTFTQEEELAQDCWVKCSKTDARERSVKKLDIWTAPECLLVHLKRFGSSQCGDVVEKVSTKVRAPLDLDLEPWLRGPSSCGDAQYKLYAVVNHSGSLNAGHYTAHCRVGEGAQRDWFYFSDVTVQRVQESEVVVRSESSAYILFYERVRPHDSLVSVGVV